LVQRNALAIALLIVGLVVGIGIGYAALPGRTHTVTTTIATPTTVTRTLTSTTTKLVTVPTTVVRLSPTTTTVTTTSVSTTTVTKTVTRVSTTTRTVTTTVRTTSVSTTTRTVFRSIEYRFLSQSGVVWLVVASRGYELTLELGRGTLTIDLGTRAVTMRFSPPMQGSGAEAIEARLYDASGHLLAVGSILASMSNTSTVVIPINWLTPGPQLDKVYRVDLKFTPIGWPTGYSAPTATVTVTVTPATPPPPPTVTTTTTVTKLITVTVTVTVTTSS